MAEEGKYVKAVKSRATMVRLRTWSLTLVILVALVFYILVSVTMRQSINWIDFVLLCTVQIVMYCLYFPDGDLFGQKDASYIANKTAYNAKATEINQNYEISKLREYCLVEYEERKQRYILNECGMIGITVDELEILRQNLDEKATKKLKVYEFEDGKGGIKRTHFSANKRKRLHRLLHKPLPVEQNYAETIMSAVENNGYHSIKDGSTSYKAWSYVRRVLQSVVIGGVLAYIGYTVKDGIGLAEIMTMLTYLTTMLTTAVFAFSAGETCSKVHKSRFYVELVNFIDGFKEWHKKQPKEKGETK